LRLAGGRSYYTVYPGRRGISMFFAGIWVFFCGESKAKLISAQYIYDGGNPVCLIGLQARIYKGRHRTCDWDENIWRYFTRGRG